MLKKSDINPGAMCFGAKLLSIRGQRYNNSAAKFWSALIDELVEDHTGCRKITVAAVNEGNLNAEQLFPEMEFQRDLDLLVLEVEDAGAALRRACDAFELYGLPGSVSLKIYEAGGEIRRLALPMDCVDAEMFLYLLAWLLEWSGVRADCWNEPRIKGAFSATDPLRSLEYHFDFTVEHAPLKEGLFSWRLDLTFQRSNSRCGKMPPASLEARAVP